MYIIKGINDVGNFYEYAILEEHESYDFVDAAISEQMDSRIAFYFEHDEPIVFCNENIVEIISGYQYQIKQQGEG
jgi:hypothetical protein